MLFDIYLQCLNKNYDRLTIHADSYVQAIKQTKGILQDNEGGSAELIAQNGLFKTIVEG